MTEGVRANKRGRWLENTISDLLVENYNLISAKEFSGVFLKNEPIFARQCLFGQDIYGKNRRVDLILFHPEKWKNNLIIQCKWQASSGSVEEKFPFEVASIKKSQTDTIIVLDGKGYSKGAENWLKDQVGKDNLVNVMDLGEIHRFHSKGLL